MGGIVLTQLLLKVSKDLGSARFRLSGQPRSDLLAKKRLRVATLRKIRTALPLDLKDAVVLGAKQVARARLGRWAPALKR